MNTFFELLYIISNYKEDGLKYMNSVLLGISEAPTFDYRIFLTLAIILITTKILGILMRKLGLPQVVGAILTGLLLGPFLLRDHAILTTSTELKVIAEIGVILIMFSAGLDTNLKEIKQNGVPSIVITLLGVIVPLGLGYVIAGLFFGFGAEHTLKNLFVGVILTATSVGITVEVLKEMGKLKGKVGVSILSAAILDDIIGIIILTVIIGIGGQSNGSGEGVNYLEIFLKTAGFFVFAIVVGIMCHYVFKWMGKKFPNKRRVPIISLAICFAFAFIAEAVFGIADITGAYMAGIMLSNMKETQYVERKVDINSYMLFSPVFFCNIGLSATSEGLFDPAVIGFAVVFVIAGLLAKFLGCGAGAKMCKYTWRESAQVGLGMMARGEVCLIVASKGIAAGLLEQQYLTAAILLVVVSSLLTPILLKVAYKQSKKERAAEQLGVELPKEADDAQLPSIANAIAERPLDMSSTAYDHLHDLETPSMRETIHDALTNNENTAEATSQNDTSSGESENK